MPDVLPAWAAEFPNDNPALHEGVSWVCLSVLGPAKPVRRPGSPSRPLASVASLVPAMAPGARVVPAPLPVAGPVLPEERIVAEAPEAAPSSTPEPLSESVLTALLEKLDLDLTPSSSPVDDVLDIDASDLEHTPLPETATYADVVAELQEALEFAPESAGDLALPGPAVVAEAGTENFPAADGDPSASLPSDAVALSEPEAEAPMDPVVEAPLEGEADPPSFVAEEAGLAAESGAQAYEIIVISSDPPAEAAPPAAAAAPSPDDDYVAFVGALVEVLLAHGATRAGAVLPSLLESGTVDAALLDDPTVRSLGDAKITEAHGGTVRLREDFAVTARAWRDVLRGTSQDLGACGTSTLDGWASDLLRALGVGREGRVDVRRELRRRGVAAFGMLRAA